MNDVDVSLQAARTALREENWCEAETQARRVLRLQPTNFVALYVLACAHSDRGDDFEAQRLFRQTTRANPQFAPAFRRLAAEYYASNRHTEAVQLYGEWALTDPGNAEVQHMLAAFTGNNVPPRCSASYIESYFNNFAATFEAVLVKQLEYRGHQVAVKALKRHLLRSCDTVVDAGCGTGLCGPLLRPLSRYLIGVDLAQKMIDRAEERHCYDELVISDLSDFMEAKPESFDAIVASDVLIYFGSLEQPLGLASRALRRGGLIVFNVERLDRVDGGSFTLQTSGRYAHRDAYIRQAVMGAGLRLLEIEEEVLRWEGGKSVVFFTAVGRRP